MKLQTIELKHSLNTVGQMLSNDVLAERMASLAKKDWKAGRNAHNISASMPALASAMKRSGEEVKLDCDAMDRDPSVAYDPESDTYTCAAGKPIRYDHDKYSKSAGGLNITTSVYVCDHCKGCPLKEKCIRAGSKKPLEERSKVIYVSKRFAAQREAMEALPGSETALFLSMQRKRITARAVENLVKKYARIASPLKKITPHKLRSTYGTMLYQESGDIYLVADVLGHKDVNTTRKS